jgi:hypothetical protein
VTSYHTLELSAVQTRLGKVKEIESRRLRTCTIGFGSEGRGEIGVKEVPKRQ